MTMTIAEARAVPEATGKPDRLTFKTAETTEAPVGQMLAIDESQGIVEAIVSVTGVIDEVDDIIVPGAYRETLMKRNPKVCWAHSWEHPIGKVLAIEELLPGDDRLPTMTRDHQPWPKEAGALVARMQFNLRTDEGKNAFEVVRFYSESGECEYSIGYNVPPGNAATKSGVRYIKMLELYELSVVLFGAHTMTGTLSIKTAWLAAVESKRLIGRRGLDMKALLGLASKAAPPFVRKGEEEKPEDTPGNEDGGEGDPAKPECTCCGGSGEHDDGHECYACDSAGTLEAQSEYDGNVDEGQPLVCEGHHGRPDPDPEREHTPDPVSPDAAPEGTPVAGQSTEPPDDNAAPEDGSDGAEDASTHPGDRPPPGEQASTGEGDENKPDGAPESGREKPNQPDFSRGIMVAIYPDPAAADAVANHIAGPDETMPREELHVTLAYLGKVGDAGVPEEQAVIDAVTRAVEGQPALEGEVGGIGQFPPGEDGTPTYAPVDVAGLSLLREQIVAELGDAVFTDHGFTPHMTLGYNIGLIEPVPPTPLRINEVRVVYGASQRGISLGTPLPESKSRTFVTEEEPAEAKTGDRWLRIADDVILHVCESDEPREWKVIDVIVEDEPAPAAAYDPALDFKTGNAEVDAFRVADPRLGMSVTDLLEGKAGGADRNRGEAEELRKYWTTGEGGLRIGWGTEGDFSRCVVELSEHMTPERAKGYCANRHKEMTGMWPGDKNNKDGGSMTDTKAGDVLAAPMGKSAYPYMPGSYEERQQQVREGIEAQYEDDRDDHGHRNVYIDMRATWPDRVLYSAYNNQTDKCEHYLTTYRIDDDGGIEFGERDEVDLMIVPVDVEDGEEEAPLGDAFPLVEGIMSVAASLRTAQQGMEGKAGRVLSGANERALREAITHLVNVLAAAGVDLGEVDPDKPRPVGNTGSDGDVRKEIDPAVDLQTTSPTATTKDAGADTEGKAMPGQGGEVLTIDMEAHRELLAAIEAETGS